MKPGDVRLPGDLAARLDQRAQALLAHGSLLEDVHAGTEAERAALAELSARLRTTYPYPDPRYAGQMLKPPVAVAWAAYATAMLLNPNNHALDGGPATAEMEREAVADIAAMFGLPQHLGHLTASGTIANLEALWVARELRPGETVLSGAIAATSSSAPRPVVPGVATTVPTPPRPRRASSASRSIRPTSSAGTVSWSMPRTADTREWV